MRLANLSRRAGRVPTQVAFSQSRRFDDFDNDRKNGVIRDAEHAFNKDGGLAVLFGNLARRAASLKPLRWPGVL